MVWLLTVSKALHVRPPVASTGDVDTGMKELEETLMSALVYFSETKSHLPAFSTRIQSAFVKATKTIRPKPKEKPKPKPLRQMNLEPLQSLDKSILNQPGLISMHSTTLSGVPSLSLRAPPSYPTMLTQPVASTSGSSGKQASPHFLPS